MTGYRLAGAATPAGTARHADHFAGLGPRAFAPLGRTGLVASRLGFGAYRVDDQTPGHREALESALQAGVNLIDTSTNYTDGGSERLIGQVVADGVERGAVRRDELVVVSKIGYVQGENLDLARARESAGRPFPEMVKYMDGCWHCLHPAFLADQLPRSLARLRLETLDVCLLHNPEYFFSDAKQRAEGSLPELRDEFYRRLGEAFRFLEGEVAAGHIGAYGVSSNTCTSPPDDPEATALARMLEVARAAGGPGHHFRVLQLPLNLVEAGALQGALPAAIREEVAVLVNRPLNAMAGRGMLRLADFVVAEAPPPGEQLAVLAVLEEEFRREIASRLQVTRGANAPDDLFRWAEHLDGLAESLESLDHWEQIENHMIVPRVAHAVRALDAALRGDLGGRWQDWRGRYQAEIERMFAAFRRVGAEQSRAGSLAVAAAVDPWLPAPFRRQSLSRKALWVVASTPGVSAVLVGMRRTEYVNDAMEVARWPGLEEVQWAYEAVAMHVAGPTSRL
ncbi:MAG TPA: aldo/keto reductase [Candidatus Binatia bacterium]|nr:aldo/keto reductase [Candidatus Binatia bacterium]